MNRIFTIVFLTVFSTFLFSQSFVDAGANLTSVGEGSSVWGDYDNDGDLDLAMTGVTASGTFITQICRNDSGSFVIIEPGIPGLYASSLAWGDYDIDGDLDLMLTGASDTGPYAELYANNNGIFEEVNAGLPGIDHGQVHWVDFDNDADLDLFMTGSWMSILFENDNGLFTEFAEFDVLQNSRCDWGDYDNDGFQDLLLTGDNGGGFISKIYRNIQGVFVEIPTVFEGLFSGTAEFIDFDVDGDLDISLSGFDLYLEPRLMFFTNEGNGEFIEFPTYILGVALSAVEWADYDSDGDPDIFISGKTAGCGGITTNIWRNTGTGFEEDFTTSFPGFTKVSAKWADFENDGDMDILLTGLSATSTPVTILYRNNFGTNAFMSNNLPLAPQTLNSLVDGDKVLLSWSRGSDTETSAMGLSYNLRLGSDILGTDIISPLSIVSTGYRMVPAIGNAGQDTNMLISGLDPGTYFWSVQSIDHAFGGSAFFEEESFEVIATGFEQVEEYPAFRIFPNPAVLFLNIERKGFSGDETIRIFSSSGLLVGEYPARAENTTTINISHLTSGLYSFVLTGSGFSGTFFKK
ncbi:MAG: T9SS type A sorting domain-containing protein [Bacteroidetes bacterium]|nr:T9SS type A sorting domain-containing protein [Bacteroidota bacterium]